MKAVEKNALIQQSSNEIFHEVNRNVEKFRSERDSGGHLIGSLSAQSMASLVKKALSISRAGDSTRDTLLHLALCHKCKRQPVAVHVPQP